ncbi:MAG: DUF4351 domain-containing protein [Acidobacteriota bacterium]|nr:DUF4351 domain-containing protein [Acidobacteriota bacterium]
MHEYDAVLKLLLQRTAQQTMEQLFLEPVRKWLNVELPEVVQNTRADLLGETSAGELIHLELQSSNDSKMALRMAEYALRIYRLLGKYPRQLLLYVGEAELRMPAEIDEPGLSYHYRSVDIRSLDGSALLVSPNIGDNVIAILARLQDARQAVRQALARIGSLGPAERESAFRQLLLLAGLRRLEEYVEEEAKKMPVLNSILEHNVLGREFKRGLQEGRHEGLQEGRHEGLQEGRHEGELVLLRRILTARFGTLAPWAETELARRSESELSDLGARLFDVSSLEDLLR